MIPQQDTIMPEDHKYPEGLKHPESMCYDPLTRQSFFLSKEGVLFQTTEDEKSQLKMRNIYTQPDMKNVRSLELGKEEEKKGQCLPDTLRFVPNAKAKNLILSPSGLMVISKQSAKSTELPLLYTNYGFSSGIHYWEIYLPLSCINIKLGAVKIENNKVVREEMNAFRTTSKRVAGILLDLEAKQLKFWLNGKEQIPRMKPIVEGYWVPAVRICGIDNCLILNPFAEFGIVSTPFTAYNANNTQSALMQDFNNYFDHWLFITGLQTDIEESKMTAKEYLLKEIKELIKVNQVLAPVNNEKKRIGCALANYEKEEDAILSAFKPNLPPSINVLKLEDIVKILFTPDHPLISSLIQCVSLREQRIKERVLDITRNILKLDRPLIEAIAKSEEFNFSSFGEASRDINNTISSLNYLPYSDKILVTSGNTLKLVSREKSQEKSFLQPENEDNFRVRGYPRTAQTQIILSVSMLEALNILHKINYEELINQNKGAVLEHIFHFIYSLSEAVAHAQSQPIKYQANRQTILMQIKFIDAKKALDTIFRTLLQLLSSTEQDTPKILKEVYLAYKDPLLVALKLPEEDFASKQKHLSIDEIHLLISIVSKWDEQLRAMTESNAVTDSLLSLWDIRTSRNHTAYGRLNSFVTWPATNAVEMAEMGLINTGDKRMTIKHFMDMSSFSDTPLMFDSKTKSELWANLEKQLPGNRMLNGEPCVNVALDVTMKNLPPLNNNHWMNNGGKTESNQEQKISYIEAHDDSPYVLACREDGYASVWHTGFRLYFVAKTHFRKRYHVEKGKSGVKVSEKTGVAANNSELTGKMFDDEENNQFTYESVPPVEPPKPEEKKKEEEKKNVVPKQEFVEQLIAMGFSTEIAKKALIQVNNESVEAAMDAVLDLQKKGFITRVEDKKEAKKEKDFIILSWQCSVCTLINAEGKTVCEVCNSPAPQSAYKSTKKPEPAQSQATSSPAKKVEEAAKKEEETTKKANEVAKKSEEIPQPSAKKEEEDAKKGALAEESLINERAVCFALMLDNNNATNPFSIACCLIGQSNGPNESSSSSLLKIRRFKYDSNYLASFVQQVYYSNKLQNSAGWESQITDSWIKQQDDQEIRKLLLAESRENIEIISPLFVKNQLKPNWNIEQTNLAESHIIYAEELEYKLECKEILGMCSIKSNLEEKREDNIIVVGKTNEGIKLFKYGLANSQGEANDNRAGLSAKIVKLGEMTLLCNELAISITKAKVLTDNQLQVIVAFDTHGLFLIDSSKLVVRAELKQVFKNLENLSIIKERIKEDIVNNNHLSFISKIAYLDINGVKIISLLHPEIASKAITAKEEKKEIEAKTYSGELTALPPASSSNEMPEIKAGDLQIEDLIFYERQMRHTRIGSEAGTEDSNIIIYSTNKDYKNKLYSKHYWSICEATEAHSKAPSQSKFSFVLSPPSPVILNHISLSLTFLRKTQELPKPIMAAPQAIVAPSPAPLPPLSLAAAQPISSAPSPPIKGIGLISVRGTSLEEKDIKKYYIPLIVYAFRGSQYSYNITSSRMVTDNTLVFASNYPKPEFIFCHQFGKRMLIEKFTVRADLISMCGACPVGTGLIFLSDTIAPFTYTSEYSKITSVEAYQKWKEERKQSPKPMQPSEPVGFFEMGSATTITCDIDIKRASFYIMVKPTSFRNIPGRAPQDFNTYPLEIQFFGVTGRVFEEDKQDLESVGHTPKIPNIEYITPYNISIELLSDNKWVPSSDKITEISVGYLKTGKAPSDIDVREILLANGNNSSISHAAMNNLNRYAGLYKTAITDSKLQTIPAKAYRITIEKNGDSKSMWELMSIGAELHVPSQSEISSKALKGFPLHYLRPCMSDISLFHRVNKAIVELTTNPSASTSLRSSACQLLHKIALFYPQQIKPIVETLKVDDFIQLNIYQQEKGNVNTAIELLQELSSDQKFCKDIYIIILRDVSNVPFRKLSPSGFDAFLELLKYCMPLCEEEAILKLMKTLYKASATIADKMQDPLIVYLRTRMNINGYPFDPWAFYPPIEEEEVIIPQSSQPQSHPQATPAVAQPNPPVPSSSTSPSTASQATQTLAAAPHQIPQSQKISSSAPKQMMPLKAKIILQWNANADEFTIDLTQKCLIKKIRLIFGKVDNAQYKIKISLFALVKNKNNKSALRQILYQSIIEDHIWLQVTDFAYRQTSAFDPSEELEAVELPIQNHVGRYLIIQLEYIKTHKTIAEEDSSLPVMNVIPEIYGKALETGENIEEIEELIEKIEKTDEKRIETIKEGHSLHQEKLEVLKGMNIIMYKNYIEGSDQKQITAASASISDEKEMKESGEGKEKAASKIQIPAIAELQRLQADLRGLTLEAMNKNNNDAKIQIKSLLKQINKELKNNYYSSLSRDDIGISTATSQAIQQQSIKPSLQYMTSVCVEYAKLIRNCFISKSPNKMLAKRGSEPPLVEMAKILFKAFVVHEKGEVREELLNLLKDVIIPSLDDIQWLQFIFDSINEYLSTPNPSYSQKSVIAALDYLSIPDGEILSFMVKKLNINCESQGPMLLQTLFSEKQLSPDKHKATELPEKTGVSSSDPNSFTLASSILILALNSLKKVQLPEGEAVHKGVSCNSCNNQKYITGPRFKCGHCLNYNSCGNEKCLEKHLNEFPDHAFIVIFQALPYSPNPKDLKNIQLKALLPTFSYVQNSKTHEDVDCEACGKKSITGIRYLCGNCDDWNLCSDCFLKEAPNHMKTASTHVFIRLTQPLVPTNSTPKPYLQLLDPLLYPIPSTAKHEDLLLPLSSKRSYSLTTERDEKVLYERLDYDQNMNLSYSILKWICLQPESILKQEQKKILLKLGLDLFNSLIRLANIEATKKLLEDSQSFIELIFYILSFNDRILAENRSNLSHYVNEIINTMTTYPHVKKLTQEQMAKMKPHNRAEYLKSQEKALQVKVLLCSHIQYMLKTLVDIAHNGKHIIEVTPIFSIYNNQNIWNDHLSYLLEMFLNVAEKSRIQKCEYKIDEKEQKIEKQMILLPPPLARSISLQANSPLKDGVTIEHLAKVTLLTNEKFVEYTTLSLHIIKSLVDLLSPHHNNLKAPQYIANLWTMVLKALTMIPLSVVIEKKLFDRLVSSFLQSPEEIQQTTYSEILKMTQRIVKEPAHANDVSKFLLNLLFATLENAIGTSNETLAFNICSGWLDILIARETPKPEDYIGEIFIKLTEEDTMFMLRKGIELLVKHLSLGSIDSVTGSQNSIIMKIELIHDIFRIIAGAKGVNSQSTAISLLFKNKISGSKSPAKISNSSASSRDLLILIPDLIVWLLLNEKLAPGTTPAAELHAKLSNHVKDILYNLGESEELVKVGLSTLINFIQEFDKKISICSETESMSFAIATKLNDKINKLLVSLIETWVTTDELALCFATEIRGFEFLLDRIRTADTRANRLGHNGKEGLSLTEEAKKTVDRDQSLLGTDLDEAINKQLSLGISKDLSKEEEVSANLNKKYDPLSHHIEEYAKTMVIESTSGGDVLTSYLTTDWSVNKKGNKHKVFTKSITGALKNEFSMTFRLKTTIEISEIQMGIINYWGNSNELYLEPSSIIVEGGMNTNNMSAICTLNKIRDDGFASHCSAVFGRNMETFSSENGKTISQLLDNKFDSLPHFRVKYLRFTLRKGVVTCLDNSPMLNLLKKQKFFAINYISVSGYDVSNLGNFCAYIFDTQKETALQVLLQFCSPEYTKTLKVIAFQEDTLSKIKSSFKMLAGLINTKENLIEPTFIAISALNKEMGEWFINQLMQNNSSRRQITLLTELILSHLGELPRRINNYKEFIFAELKKCLKAYPEEGIEPLRGLKGFLLNYVKALRLSGLQFEKERKEKSIPLEVSEESILYPVMLLEKCVDTKLLKQLIKFILIQFYPPSPFVNASLNPYKFVIKHLFTPFFNDPKIHIRLILASYFAATDKTCAEAFMENAPLLEQLKKGIPDDLQQGIVPIKILLQAWLNCTVQPIVRDKLNANGIPFILYESLKLSNIPNSNVAAGEAQSSQTSGISTAPSVILKSLPDDLLQITVELIKALIAGRPDLEKDMSKRTIEDLELLTSRRDLNYVNSVLVPILRMEQSIPICLQAFDSDAKKYVFQKAKSSNSNSSSQIPAMINIPTALLSLKQKAALSKQFKTHFVGMPICKKLCNAKWNKLFSDSVMDQTRFTKLWNTIQLHGQTLFIISGMQSGKPVIFGGFCTLPMPQMPSNLDPDYNASVVSKPDECFFFFYEGDNCRHFKLKQGDQFMSFIVDQDISGALSFANDVFWLSGSNDYSTQFGDISGQIECIENASFKFTDLQFSLNSIEVWNAKTTKQSGPMEEAKKIGAIDSGKTKEPKHPWINFLYPYHLFRLNPVYNVPSGVTAEQLSTCLQSWNEDKLLKLKIRHTSKPLIDDMSLIGINQEILEKYPYYNGVLDLEYDIQEQTEKESAKVGAASPSKKPEVETDNNDIKGYLPKMGVFERFEEYGGVKQLISVTLRSLKLWKNADAAAKCTSWLQELETFSTIPGFFKLFIKNKMCKDILFKMLAGVPDHKFSSEDKKVQEKEQKKWEEEHQMAVKITYQNIAEVFKVSTDSKMREQAFENGLIDKILLRISAFTGEKGRKWVEEETKQPSTTDKKEPESKSPDQKKELRNVDKKKRKGVGYVTNAGEVWKVQDYIESQKAKNEQIKIMIDILASFISAKDWHPTKDLMRLFAESAVILLIESGFRSGSLLEMSKEASLYMSYLDITRAFASQRKLIPLLIDLDQHYIPKQSDSIYTLLKKLNELSHIFLTCLKKETTEEAKATATLANEIQSVYTYVTTSLEAAQSRKSRRDAIKDALALPLRECYNILLKDLRFDYMDMKDQTGNYVHHYSSTAAGKTNPPSTKIVRLAQELADLSNSLPYEHTNAIFVRVDKERADMMKAVIMGASNTPYAHGAFEYDIFLDNNYPNEPPKMNLTTTGSGAIRFNPNLYNCGKVCLSLLGTWRGQANENWDPRFSSIHQLLVSTQAIIMSEEVYFNEPGFENEQGTPEGEKRNEAYSNVVRYGNIKFAMTGQIRNPAKGFEKVIQRHFYIKKDEILKEVKSWIDLADKNEASYNGIVSDHNMNYCKMFKENKTKYKEMLVEAIKELEVELNKLPPPSGEDIEKMKQEDKEEKLKIMDITEGAAKIDLVDASDDKSETHKQKKLDIEDEEVKDRWSRYIGALGVDAVSKQASASIFLSGINPLGIEIAKNLVLSGCKKFTIHDNKTLQMTDLAGQFFASSTEVNQNRAKVSLAKLQQLNYYVNVTDMTEKLPTSLEGLEKITELKEYSVFIMVDSDRDTEIALSEYCRKYNKKYIYADVKGVCARVFADYGETFECLDKDGEECVEVMISSISTDEKGLVKALGQQRHKLETGDEILLTEVQGMLTAQGKSINNCKFKVTVIDPYVFAIGDTKMYSPYIRNGIAKQVKQPKLFKSVSWKKTLMNEVPLPIDQSTMIHDFAKMNDNALVHYCFEAAKDFEEANKRLMKEWDEADAKAFSELVMKKLKQVKFEGKTEDKIVEFSKAFSKTYSGTLPPLAAFVGGFVSQEVVKAITQKFSVLSQMLCMHFMELLPKEVTTKAEALNLVKDRYSGIRITLGDALVQKLKETSLFMVGCGAIGCELLKNYAMLGIGTSDPSVEPKMTKRSRVVITDPDVIEPSNLNRQFLFREKHLRKPKSSTAAASAIAMNPDLKDHILARLDKVHENSAHIFTDKFFMEQTLVTNALDNIQARRYIDSRCVSTRIPLIESGTLGPKGHVQVVVPYKTESYSSQADPEDNTQIPHCTLKMFPEEVLHCVEWARDKFEKLFTQQPKTVLSVIEKGENYQPISSQEITSLKQAIRCVKKRPMNWEDCVKLARKKFQKYFINDIRQLLFVYPLEHKTKDGTPFWSLPKRPPHELKFNPGDSLFAAFIAACASLFAVMWNIKIPLANIRSEADKLKAAAQAAGISFIEFQPSAEKAKEIAQQVSKEEDKKEEGKQVEQEKVDPNDVAVLLKDWQAILKQLPKKKGPNEPGLVLPQEFEKDIDSNGHIDFIYCLANCRARNYILEEMSWINVKLKAGRIIPALATTTACIAGLQTIEVIKLVKGIDTELHRNAFLNLALPSLSLSEPGAPKKIELRPGLQVTLWDRWDFKPANGKNVLMKELFHWLETTYKLFPRDVSKGSKYIYLSALMDNPEKKQQKEELMNKKLFDVLSLKEESYVELSVTCAKEKEGKIIDGVPMVRVIFNAA